MIRELRYRGRLGLGRDKSRSLRHDSDRDERGAVAVLTSFILIILMGISAVVVDLGLQRVTRSDLQALADVVALDLAREITGARNQASLATAGDFSNPASAVRKSAARNADVLGDDLWLEVDWGSYENEQWDSATDPPRAVRVTATANTDYAVVDGSGDVSREAFAVASNSACYRLGTFVAAITSGDSTVLGPLNDLLDVNLQLVGYRALADAQVTLAELAATSVIGSPNQLLTGSVSYSNLIRAMIEVLSKKGATYSAAVSALRVILGASGTVGNISLGNVMHVSPSDRAALGMKLNVLDIVGSARLSDGQHFVSVPNIQAGVAGVGSHFEGGLALISAAQLACGTPNSAESVSRNAQLAGSLGIEFVNLPSLNVKGVGTLQTAKGTGTLRVDVADGQGQLVAPPEVKCGDGTASNPHQFSVAVQTQPAAYSLSADLNVNGEVKVSVLDDLGLGEFVVGSRDRKVTIEIDARLWVGTSAAGSSSMANLTIPPNDKTPVQTGTSVVLDPATLIPTATRVKIEGWRIPTSRALRLTDPILDELTYVGNDFFGKTMIPLIDNINNVFIGPVARMVGLRFGGADVYAVGAVCGEPSLWG